MAITLTQAAAGLTLSELPGRSPELVKQIGEFHGRVDGIRKRIATYPDVDELIERACEGEVDAVISLIDSATINVLDIAGQLYKLWQQRRDLATAAATELQIVSEKAEKARVKATAEARAKIEAAGLTPSCMPYAEENGSAAEIRFTNTILNFHPLIKKGMAAAHDAKNVAEVAKSQIGASEQGAEAVSNLIRVLARRELAGAIA